jgi:hypothetical protein
MYEPELHAMGIETRLDVADGTLITVPRRDAANAPGVDGLLEVLPAIGQVDADAVLSKVPSNPRIGELLAAACGEAGFRAWLTAMPATRSAGRNLQERIEAARRDLMTRSMAVGFLDKATREWLPMLEAALTDDRLNELVLKGADPAGRQGADNILLWTVEDREWRHSLLAEVQRLRGSARLQSLNIPRLGIDRVSKALGGEALTAEAQLLWKMNQKGRFPGGTLEELMARVERDLSLRIRIKGGSISTFGGSECSFGQLLDSILIQSRLCYRVQGEEIVILPLEDLLR